MDELPRYYLRIFNAVTDAIKAIEQMNYGMAHELLVEGQRWSEELYARELEGKVTSQDELEILLSLSEEEKKSERSAVQEAKDALANKKMREYFEKMKRTLEMEDAARDGKPAEPQTM